MPSQAVNGKAFEYAILNQIRAVLNTSSCDPEIPETKALLVAKNAYCSFERCGQEPFDEAAREAVKYIINFEPRIKGSFTLFDRLCLELASDNLGQKGDVRDVLIRCPGQNWEIGISAKNNHKAVKHSRLSPTIDFGNEWLNIPCSNIYFKEINLIFDFLKQLRENNPDMLWADIDDLHQQIYFPILEAFRKELIRLDKDNNPIVASRLVQYLIGNQDFYKVIKGKNDVTIQAFNINGTLNKSYLNVKPKGSFSKLTLPKRLVDISYKQDSKTTLNVILDEGWQLSFRIHNASSKIENSLKFDIQLVSNPDSLFSNRIYLQ